MFIQEFLFVGSFDNDNHLVWAEKKLNLPEAKP